VHLRLCALPASYSSFSVWKSERTDAREELRAILLVDTSQSMGLRDSDSSNVPAAMSRLEHVVAELSRGTLG